MAETTIYKKGILGTDLAETIPPTIGAYIPLQKARKQEIFSSNPKEFAYGSHARQKLDLFLPPSSQSEAKLPVVVFAYGGGLVRGDKQMAPAEGALYANVGQFFSARGFATVVLDYRLYGVHDAKFPSGGEDVALAIQYVVENVKEADTSRIFLVGNSAGGVHAATSLWCDSLPCKKPSPKALILVSTPLAFRDIVEYRLATLNGYFNNNTEGNSPLGLRKTSKDTTKTLLILAEKDSEHEIVSTNEELLALFPLPGIEKPEEFPVLKGHNHASPFMALGLGGVEDAWGEDLVKWMHKQV